jgi:hypothetical protein
MVEILTTILIIAITPELLRIVILRAGLSMPVETVKAVGRKCGS